MRLDVNGLSRAVAVDGLKPLLWVLREDLGLNGTKYGCGLGLCGCCTVLVGGEAVRSCTTPVGSVGDREVVTIEGLDDPLGRALKDAWIDEHVAQCGYCQPGQIIAAYALLREDPRPSDRQVDAAIPNLCRCGTYQRIRSAIARVSRSLPRRQPLGAGAGQP
jgi:isoquinoline 1-oxidoreductase alpha subunit